MSLLKQKRGLLTAVLASCLSLAAASGVLAQQGSSSGELQAEARQIVQQFVGELKPTLKKAMGQGGPTQAIAVCSEKAPAISKNLSKQSGWQVKRVSLKQRNPNAAPDPWERQQLKAFDRRQAAGEAPAQINAAERVNGTFRYMQAQGVEPLCLSCHGENLASAVQDALQRFYPNDEATGYQLGQVRGAISLQKNLAD